ncbi:MAG: hypothetical protein ACYTFO_03905 [Planctomycetota bacterium]|jgi:GAF domain-containing protein
MRWVPVVILLAAIAAGLVQLRRQEAQEQYQANRLDLQQVQLRRQLDDQQMRLSGVTSPLRIRQLVRANGLDLADRTTGMAVQLTDVTRPGQRP